MTTSIQKLYPREWSSWENMHQRCNNPKHVQFNDYGGRGISICPEWDRTKGGNFYNFLEDMGFRPDDLTLDRIDGEQGYCKENCQWSTRGLQNYNRRLRKDNSNGKTGISWNKDLSKYATYICVEKKQIHLGYFSKLEDALAARSEAEIEYYGFTKV